MDPPPPPAPPPPFRPSWNNLFSKETQNPFMDSRIKFIDFPQTLPPKKSFLDAWATPGTSSCGRDAKSRRTSKLVHREEFMVPRKVTVIGRLLFLVFQSQRLFFPPNKGPLFFFSERLRVRDIFPFFPLPLEGLSYRGSTVNISRIDVYPAYRLDFLPLSPQGISISLFTVPRAPDPSHPAEP